VSRENVEIVRAGMEAWNRRDFDAVLETLDPAVEWRLSGAVPDVADVYHGPEGVRAFWTDWTGSWEDIRNEPEDYIELEDGVLVLVDFRASGRSQIVVDQPVAFHFTLRDGLVIRFQSYWDRDEAFEAVGLRRRR
jgi:ketosteroid isomerase-like protein